MYCAGYDVFLGNFRGLVSREHVNKNISSYQYVDKANFPIDLCLHVYIFQDFNVFYAFFS